MGQSKGMPLLKGVKEVIGYERNNKKMYQWGCRIILQQCRVYPRKRRMNTSPSSLLAPTHFLLFYVNTQPKRSTV